MRSESESVFRNERVASLSSHIHISCGEKTDEKDGFYGALFRGEQHASLALRSFGFFADSVQYVIVKYVIVKYAKCCRR